MKDFHMSCVVSILSGRLVSIRNMAGILDIMSHLYGRPVMTHEIPEIIGACRDNIVAQYPMFRHITEKSFSADNYKQFLERTIELFGAHVPLRGPADGYTAKAMTFQGQVVEAKPGHLIGSMDIILKMADGQTRTLEISAEALPDGDVEDWLHQEVIVTGYDTTVLSDTLFVPIFIQKA